MWELMFEREKETDNFFGKEVEKRKVITDQKEKEEVIGKYSSEGWELVDSLETVYENLTVKGNVVVYSYGGM